VLPALGLATTPKVAIAAPPPLTSVEVAFILVPVELEKVPPVTVKAENSVARVAMYKLNEPVDSKTAV
jgi:hypothetical protein